MKYPIKLDVMRLVEKKATKDYIYKKFIIKENKYMYIIRVFNIENLQKYKSYYNQNWFVVKRVYIKGDNEEFKLVIYKWSFWTHGRTKYIKNNREIPFYLTGI